MYDWLCLHINWCNFGPSMGIKAVMPYRDYLKANMKNTPTQHNRFNSKFSHTTQFDSH